MDSELLQTLIYEDYGYKSEGRNWGRAEEHSSLIVNEEAQKWYWNSRDSSGGVLEYLLYVRKMSKSKAQELLRVRGKIAGMPEETPEGESLPYERLVELLWSAGKSNRDYWYARKLTDKTIDRNQLGYDNGWSLIPLYEGNRFVNFQCRRDEPKKSIRYWYDHDSFKPVLLNKEVLNIVDKIFITEGTVDSLLLTQEGIPAVASTGGSGYWDNSWYSMFGRIKDIVYIADNDKAGKWASKRISEALGKDRVRILTLGDVDGYDTVDFFRDGGTSEQLKSLVETDSKYGFEIGDFSESSIRKRKSYRVSNKSSERHRRW